MKMSKGGENSYCRKQLIDENKKLQKLIINYVNHKKK